MTYDHSSNDTLHACGISKERYKEMIIDLREIFYKNKNKIIEYKEATSFIIEMISSMKWTETEKLYMSYDYGTFTKRIKDDFPDIMSIITNLDTDTFIDILKKSGFSPINLSKKEPKIDIYKEE